MPPETRSAETTSARDDPLEKAEAAKEKGGAVTEGIRGEKALDEAIGDSDGPDPEVTSGRPDPLEKAEAGKERK